MSRELTKLCSTVAKREGKKSQITIGNVREVVRIICELEAEAKVKESPRRTYLEDMGLAYGGPLATLDNDAYAKALKLHNAKHKKAK